MIMLRQEESPANESSVSQSRKLKLKVDLDNGPSP